MFRSRRGVLNQLTWTAAAVSALAVTAFATPAVADFSWDRHAGEEITVMMPEHPVTDGVDQVYLPMHWWDQNSFEADQSWKLLVRAEPSGYTTTDVDVPATGPHVKGTITSAPPVVAARQVGNGRILLPGMLRNYADLNKKLVLVGQGNKIEIWSDETWQARMGEWLADDASPLLANGDAFTGLSV